MDQKITQQDHHLQILNYQMYLLSTIHQHQIKKLAFGATYFQKTL